MKKNYEYFLLILILLTGGWLRFHNLGDISFSNDELSALTRARFASFHELVEKGIKVDGHPALVQTMIWVTIHLFNDDVFTVRFPFALSGIISILFLFLLARRWFGKASALLSSAALATLQFPVLYSQTARPYTIGLMCSLALAYCWTRLLFDEKKNNRIAFAYVLASTACIYTHYFSFMLAGIMGLTGLFFIKKESLLKYLVLNTLPLLLFIPSIPIFLQQFSYEGIGGWLPSPDGSFLKRFFLFGFNESNALLLFYVSILIITAILHLRRYNWSKFHFISIAWYLIPFLVGYCYSVWKAPVLQFSTLIFSFPFLLVFTFSFVREDKFPKTVLSTAVFLTIAFGTYSTVVEKKYYHTNHFGVFKELAEKTESWDKKFGTENISKLFTLSNPAYINYYFSHLRHDPRIDLYTDDEKSKYGMLTALLDTSRTEYFIYAWTNAVHAYETPALILEKYPVVVERDTFFNSEIILFKKGEPAPGETIISSTDFEKENWGYETPNQNSEVARSGIYSEKMTDKTEYSVGYKIETTNLRLASDELIKAETWFYATDTVKQASLVIAFLKDGEMYSYSYTLLKNFFVSADKWTRAILFSELPTENCEMRVYVWNQNRETFFIDDLSVKRVKHHNLYRP